MILVDWVQELLLLLPLPLVVLANLADARPHNVTVRYAGQLALYGLPAGIATLGAVEVLQSAAATGEARHSLLVVGAGFFLAGMAAEAVQLEPLLSRAARVLPLDPRSPVHRLALVLSLLVVLTQLATQIGSDVLGAQAEHGQPLSRVDIVLQELPFLLFALSGVGLGIRRRPREVLARLGLTRPAPWQVLAALAAAGGFYAFGIGMDHLAQLLTPALAHKVEAATDRIFGHLADPAGVATVAIAAGVCEEVLFRGALQPRLGLVWVAVVFTSVHTQYGLSIDAAAVLVLACGLGLLRRLANTSTSTICHVAYNGLVGFGIGWIGTVPALGGEIALAVAAVAAFVLAQARPGRPRPVEQRS